MGEKQVGFSGTDQILLDWALKFGVDGYCIGWSDEFDGVWQERLFILSINEYVEDIYRKDLEITPHLKLTSKALDRLKELQNDLQD